MSDNDETGAKYEEIKMNESGLVTLQDTMNNAETELVVIHDWGVENVA